MSKAPDAFRTISEVAEWLEVQAHVLRFWESKFSQVKPVKRAGGRRYYRPSDMLLIGGIKTLLHGEGMTIKGVQKILREKGVEHVSSLSRPLDLGPDSAETIDAVPVEAESSTADAPQMAREPDAKQTGATQTPQDEALAAVHEPSAAPPAAQSDAQSDAQSAAESAAQEEQTEPANVLTFQSRMSRKDTTAPDTRANQDAETDVAQEEPEAESIRAAEEATEGQAPRDAAPEGPAGGDMPTEETAPDVAQPQLPLEEEVRPDEPRLPSFLHRSARPAPPPDAHDSEPAPEPDVPDSPKPRVIDAPDPPPEEEIRVRAGPVGQLARIDSLPDGNRSELSALATEIRALVAARVSAHEADLAKESGLGRGAITAAPD